MRIAQFRTCLWSRAGRRSPGQEAGKTSGQTGSRSQPADPALREGRDLKQRRSGPYWSLPALTEGVGVTEEALLLPAVRNGALPNPSSDEKVSGAFIRNSLVTTAQGSRLWPASGRRPATGVAHLALVSRHLRPGLGVGEGEGRGDGTHTQIPPATTRGRTLPSRRFRGHSRKLSCLCQSAA